MCALGAEQINLSSEAVNQEIDRSDLNIIDRVCDNNCCV